MFLLREPAQLRYNYGVHRITITGSSGVGKTSLAERLTAELQIPLIAETARLLCAEMGYQRIGEIPDQEGFKRAVLESQIESENSLKESGFVADRSTIDCWILWQRWNICSAMTYDTEAVYQRVSAHSELYTHVIYVPPLFPPTDDGFRWIEPDYVKQVDRITRMTLHELGLWEKTHTITTRSLDERVEEVKAWLGI